MSHPINRFVVRKRVNHEQVGGTFSSLGAATEFAADVQAGRIPSEMDARGYVLEVCERSYTPHDKQLFVMEVK